METMKNLAIIILAIDKAFKEFALPILILAAVFMLGFFAGERVSSTETRFEGTKMIETMGNWD